MAAHAPSKPASEARRIALRCDRCEVLWRGPADEPCWSCGAPGQPAAVVIVVSS